MRGIFYLALLLAAPIFTGCSSTCDGRCPYEYCEIHHTMMFTDTVKNRKKPLPSRAYLEARAKGFVHSYPFYLPDQCGSCLVYVCNDCLRAEQEWLRQHPGEK